MRARSESTGKRRVEKKFRRTFRWLEGSKERGEGSGQLEVSQHDVIVVECRSRAPCGNNSNSTVESPSLKVK